MTAKGEDYNPVISAEARDAVGKVAWLVSSSLCMGAVPERERHDLAAEVERATIQAMKVATQPLYAEVVNLREHLEINAVLAGERCRRLREQTEEAKEAERLRTEIKRLATEFTAEADEAAAAAAAAAESQQSTDEKRAYMLRKRADTLAHCAFVLRLALEPPPKVDE